MSIERVLRSVRELTQVAEGLSRQSEELVAFAKRLVEIFNGGGRLLVIGSGALGSVADATATRFLYRLSLERPPLPALSLCHDTALAAALSREGQSHQSFVRPLGAITSGGDLVLALSDGGRDEALHEALAAARRLDCITALLAPESAPPPEDPPDFLLGLEAESPARVAEGALFFGQLLCELVETELFGI